MRAWELARSVKFPPKRAGGVGLLPQHGFGFEQAGLDLRIGADEVVDRLAEQREIVLEAADFLEPVDQVGEPDPDQLVLLPDRVELAVGAGERLFFLGDRLLVALPWRRERPPGPECPGKESWLFLPNRDLKDVQPDDIEPPPMTCELTPKGVFYRRRRRLWK